MDAPLQECSTEEQHGVGRKPVQINRGVLAQYGQSTMSQRKVYEWVDRFKSCRTRVTDAGRSGRPPTQDHIGRVDAMI